MTRFVPLARGGAGAGQTSRQVLARLTPDEAETVAAAAERAGLTASQWLRKAALAQLRREATQGARATRRE